MMKDTSLSFVYALFFPKALLLLSLVNIVVFITPVFMLPMPKLKESKAFYFDGEEGGEV